MRVIQTIASKDWGGIAFRTVEQTLWLNRHGHDCWLACPPGSEVAARAAKAGVPVVEFDFDRPFRPDRVRQFRRLVRDLDCQIIESHTGRCANAAIFAKDCATLVRTRHTTQPLKPTLSRYLRWRFGWDWTVATADVIARTLVEQRLVPEARIDVIGEWVEDRYFHETEWPARRQAWRQQLGVPDDAFLVGAVGMLRPEKAFDVLIRAVHLLRQAAPHKVMAAIVGEATAPGGAYEQDLHGLVASLGIADRVRFVGYQEDVPGLLQAFDAVAVPSVCEAQSRIIPEALASRRPVVASGVGGIVELIRHGANGWLVWPGDAAALASALRHVADAPAQAAAVGREAGRTAETVLSIDHKMAEYLAVYERARGGRGKAH